VKDPDDQVRSAIDHIFKRFEQLGTILLSTKRWSVGLVRRQNRLRHV